MRKILLALALATTTAFAADKGEAPAPTSVKGTVLEVKDGAGYSFLRLKTRDGETWAAVSRAPVKVGEQVTLEQVMVMKDFESKSMKRTFSTILFGKLAGAPAYGHAMEPGPSAAKAAPDNIRVPKASGPDARTVAEILGNPAALKDKSVAVRGQVVKFNSGIMGRNWVHLRDGTGTAPDNDLLVTSSQSAKVGDVVTAKGTVRMDKDFGAGYKYKVLVEEASLQP